MSEHGSGKDVTGASEQVDAVQLVPMDGGWISPRPNIPASERCFVALDSERRGIGFLQEFADGSAGYWKKLLEIAKPARSLEAAFAALLRESSRDTDRPDSVGPRDNVSEAEAKDVPKAEVPVRVRAGATAPVAQSDSAPPASPASPLAAARKVVGEGPPRDPRLVHADPAVAVPLDESFPWDEPAAVVAEVTRNVCGRAALADFEDDEIEEGYAGPVVVSPLAPALEVPGLLGAHVAARSDGADDPAWDCFSATLDPGARR